MEYQKDVINFYITEYNDGTLSIETKHMHYAFKDELNYDNIKKEDLYRVMDIIDIKCDKMHIKPKFLLI